MQKLSKKKKAPIALPDQQNVIYQHNRITEAYYNYSLIQERIFNYVMLQLQLHIKRLMNGEVIQQTDLFRDVANAILIKIPLSNITTPNHYQDVRDHAKQLCVTPVTMRCLNYAGKQVTKIQGLFSSIEIPDDKVRSSILTIEIKREVAELLISADYNPNTNKPFYFTSFIYEIANLAKHKYTSRIYKKCCSWKEKAGFKMSVDEFREWLQLDPKEYKNFSDIKRRILMPAQKELEKKADCWFNCAAADFEVKDGNKVVGMTFKVISPEFEDKNAKHADYCRHMLRTHLNFQEGHFKSLEKIFTRSADYGEILQKIMYLQDVINKRIELRNPIANAPGYVISSLLKDFS